MYNQITLLVICIYIFISLKYSAENSNISAGGKLIIRTWQNYYISCLINWIH